MSEESWPKPDALVSSMLGNVICFRATNYSFQKGEKLYRVESVYKIIDQEITKLAKSAPSEKLSGAEAIKTCDTCQVALRHGRKDECNGCTAPDGTMTHWRARWDASQAKTVTHAPAERSDDELNDAYMAAMEAWDAAVPHYLKGHAEWCDRFDAARKAFDAALRKETPPHD